MVGDLMSLDRLPGVARGGDSGRAPRCWDYARRLTATPRSAQFGYRDRGTMATIAGSRAVAAIGRTPGRLPRVAVWLAVHLVCLTGFKNRILVLANWTIAFLGRSRPQRVISLAELDAAAARKPPGRPNEDHPVGMTTSLPGLGTVPDDARTRGHPRWRVRRRRRRPQAEGRGRRRRAGRPARLPHVPAAALPGRHRPARDRPRSATRCATCSTTSRTSRVHEATVTGIDLDAREVAFAEMAPLAYDYLVLALGPSVNFFGVEGAAEHAFPLYTLADAVRLKEHMLERVGGGRPRPGAGGRRRAQRRRRRRRPDRRRERRRPRRAVPQRLRQGLPATPAGQGPDHPGRGRGRRLHDVQARHPRVHASRRSTSAASRCCSARSSLGRRRPASTLEVGDRDPRPHAGLGRGLQANPVVASLGVELQRGSRIPVGA